MKTLTTILLLLFSGVQLNAAIWYVDQSVGTSGNGQTWGGAFVTIEEALLSVSSGDEVYVAEGTYIPTASKGYLLNVGNVDYYGGFPSGGSSFGSRDWNTYSTILSGDVDNNGSWNNADRDHVLRITGGSSISDEIILDGFEITGGYANTSSGNHNSGGGIWINDGRLLVNHCSIDRNYALKGGGGITITGGPGHCKVYNTLISNNKALNSPFNSEDGGSVATIYTSGSASCEFYNCTLTENISNGTGHLVRSDNSSSDEKFYNSIVWDNVPYSSNSLGSVNYSENLVYDGTNLTNTSNHINKTSADPLLTATFELGVGSSAIGHGSNGYSLSSFDLNHNTRIVGTQIDCGAFEYQGRPIMYVDESVITSSSSQTGATWALAFDDLESALAAVTAGYDIYVAEGTYRPSTTNGYTIPTGDLNIYGGFEAGGSTFASRDWSAFPTIFSGDLDNSGAASVGDANSVFSAMGTGFHSSNKIRFDGVVIEKGNAVGVPYRGGGIVADFANLNFENTIIRDNVARDLGGGIFARASEVTVMNCLIHGNLTSSIAAMTGGAGIFLELSARMDIYHTTIVDNESQGSYGGAIDTDSPSPAKCQIWSSIIWGNTQASGNPAPANGVGNIFLITVDVIYDGSNWVLNQSSNVQNIILSNPMFVTGGYEPSSASPAIDQASSSNSNLSTFDLNHNGRYYGSLADLGCYEYDPNNRLAPPSIWNQAETNADNSSEGPSGIEVEEVVELSLYPNPSNGMVYLKANVETEYSVFNSFGQIVLRGIATSGENALNLSEMSTGIYTLKTESQDIRILLTK